MVAGFIYKNMEYTTDGKNLIITIPLIEKCKGVYDDIEFDHDNIIGLIDGDRKGFAKTIDMSYKDKADQWTDIFHEYWGSDKDFKALCKKLNIGLFEYEHCRKCGKTLHGTFTWSSKGPTCFECKSD